MKSEEQNSESSGLQQCRPAGDTHPGAAPRWEWWGSQPCLVGAWLGEEELKDHFPGHSSLGVDSGDDGSGHGPLGPDSTSRARPVWSVEEGDKPRVGWPGHPAEPLCALSLGWNDAPFWPVLPERGLSPRQLGKDPALPLPRLVLPPRSASRVKGPSQDMSAGLPPGLQQPRHLQPLLWRQGHLPAVFSSLQPPCCLVGHLTSPPSG